MIYGVSLRIQFKWGKMPTRITFFTQCYFFRFCHRLTAFVLRVYSQSKRYITIDDKNIEDSRNWLLTKQDSKTGCFENVGMVHNKRMKVCKLFHTLLCIQKYGI